MAPVSSNSDSLKRDRSADHGVLPLQRQGQRAGPGPPIAGCFLLEPEGRVANSRGQGFVRPQDEVHWPVHHEKGLGQHITQRCIAVEPERVAGAYVAQMGAALGHHGRVQPPLETRTHQHTHPRRSGQNLDAANHRERPEGAAAAEESRREIGDLDALAMRVEQAGLEDGCIGLVGLLAAREVFQLEGPQAAVLAGIEQSVEHRLAIETRHATPDDARPLVDQSAVRAVADHPELQRRLGRLHRDVHASTFPAFAATAA